MASKPEKRIVESAYRRVYRVVEKIPAGHVLTYGQAAELAGMPRGARVAGYAMRAVGSVDWPRPIPWQRVVGKLRGEQAHITIKDPVGAALQRQLLRAEGVRFGADGSIDLRTYGAFERLARRTRRRRKRDERPGRPGRS